MGRRDGLVGEWVCYCAVALSRETDFNIGDLFGWTDMSREMIPSSQADVQLILRNKTIVKKKKLLQLKDETIQKMISRL